MLPNHLAEHRYCVGGFVSLFLIFFNILPNQIQKKRFQTVNVIFGNLPRKHLSYHDDR